MIIIGGVAIVLVANGGWMLLAPDQWFFATPIVWRTGVPNPHFIRDVGWTYAAVGVLMICGLFTERFRTTSLMLALGWLAGHAAIHLGEVATGVCTGRQFLSESPQVWGPPILLMIGVALGRKRKRSTE